MSKWLIYPNGGKGGRSMTGEFLRPVILKALESQPKKEVPQ